MSKELELYKAFIDGLVERKDSVTARWVKGDGFPLSLIHIFRFFLKSVRHSVRRRQKE